MSVSIKCTQMFDFIDFAEHSPSLRQTLMDLDIEHHLTSCPSCATHYAVVALSQASKLLEKSRFEAIRDAIHQKLFATNLLDSEEWERAKLVA